MQVIRNTIRLISKQLNYEQDLKLISLEIRLQ